MPITKGKLFILVNAAASDVEIQTWFNHFETLSITTAPDKRILSMYLGVIGRSVESIGILYLTLRWIERAVRYCEGLAIV